jgi:chemotaxis protein CheX
MDPAYITPFMISTADVFSTMLQLPVTPGSPSIRGEDTGDNDVSAVIGISGEVTGAAILRFPMESAKRVVSMFIGEEVDENNADFSDALGELANMVTGNAKSKFTGKDVSISCPSIVVGKGHTVRQRTDVPTIAIPFTSEAGSFAIDVCLVETPAGSKSQNLAAAG